MNACQDCLKIYRSELSGQRGTTSILAPTTLKLVPLYILAMLKYVSNKCILTYCTSVMEHFACSIIGQIDLQTVINAILLNEVDAISYHLNFLFLGWIKTWKWCTVRCTIKFFATSKNITT